MSKEQIFEWFYHNSSSLTTKNIIGIFLMGFIISGIIYLTYYLTYSGVAYNSRFNVSNVALLLITIVLILMISSNIVISMGMVGALSIVRFRTAIKDPRDTVFIFWSIIEGLCVGSQNNRLALISSLIIACVLIVATYGVKKSRKYLLILRGNDLISESRIMEMLSPYISDCKMRNMHKNSSSIEMIFEVKLKSGQDETVLCNLMQCEDITYLNWLSELGEMVG
ncbi:MAG: DUF4956 domain-containing protein [Eubacteriales bacterium]|nr:DUF4956 domain-containing protein [Eubacteriales bacterium]